LGRIVSDIICDGAIPDPPPAFEKAAIVEIGDGIPTPTPTPTPIPVPPLGLMLLVDPRPPGYPKVLWA